MDDPKLFEAVTKVAVEARCVDAELVLALPIFSEIVAKVKSETDVPEAIEEMRRRRPKLFPRDDWAEKSPEDFVAAERRLKERLSRSFRPADIGNTFRELDAVGLNDEEAAALRRHLGASRNSYDRSILQNALRRQKGSGDAA